MTAKGLTSAEKLIRRERRRAAKFALGMLQFMCPKAEFVVIAANRCEDGDTDSTAISSVPPARSAALLRNAARDFDAEDTAR